jgi:uncharacterized membrane protein (DUF106 family)
MDALTQVVVWLNAAANALGRWLLAPIAVLPGWLSATLVAAVTGVLLLIVYKHTSNQKAIKRVRDDISANLLAIKLFKDSAAVALKAQERLHWAAIRLFALALVPMAVMLVPVTLILGQLSLWYQQRPLRVGEEAVVTVQLNGDADSPLPEVRLESDAAFDATLGPVRVLSRREVCWNIQAREAGDHRLVFQIGEQSFAKELAVGDGFQRVSVQRPGWVWSDALLHPWEEPFRPESPVRSIAIDYPARSSWTSGTDWWVAYWFLASMVAALCFRRALNVNV